jgi:hypothetical protein
MICIFDSSDVEAQNFVPPEKWLPIRRICMGLDTKLCAFTFGVLNPPPKS